MIVSTLSGTFYNVQLELGNVQLDRWFTRDSIVKVERVFMTSDTEVSLPNEDEESDSGKDTFPEETPQGLSPETCGIVFGVPVNDGSSSDDVQGQYSA